jgi:DNA modification methylase
MKPYWESSDGEIYHGNVIDVLRELPDESLQMCVTSPPYWGLRDYGNEPVIWDDKIINYKDKVLRCNHLWGDEKDKQITKQTCYETGRAGGDARAPANKTLDFKTEIVSQGQFCQKCNAWKGSLGLEPTPELFIQHMVQIFAEVKRVLRKDGTCWINCGDSYTSGNRTHRRGADSKNIPALQSFDRPSQPQDLKPKDLVGIPWRLAFALQADGWWLRSGVPWVKRSAMPESVTDRPTSALEYVFLFSKSQKYHYDVAVIKIKASEDSHRRYARGRSDNHKWDDGGPGNQSIAKSFDHMVKAPGVTPKSAPAGSGIKANESFHAAVGDLVGHRNFRNTDLFYQSIKPPHGAIFYGDELVGIDVNPEGLKEAHFATFPRRLVEPLILAGCPAGGNVLDIFFGSGTVGVVSYKHNRKFIGIELSKKYLDDIAIPRIEKERKQLKLF